MSARVLAPVFLPPPTDVLGDARDSGLETGWLLIMKGGPILESWIYKKGRMERESAWYMITEDARRWNVTTQEIRWVMSSHNVE